MKWYERVASDPQGSLEKLAAQRGLSVEELQTRHQRIAQALGGRDSLNHLSLNDFLLFQNQPEQLSAILRLHLDECEYCKGLGNAFTSEAVNDRTEKVGDGVIWGEAHAGIAPTQAIGDQSYYFSRFVLGGLAALLMVVVGAGGFHFGGSNEKEKFRVALLESKIQPNYSNVDGDMFFASLESGAEENGMYFGLMAEPAAHDIRQTVATSVTADRGHKRAITLRVNDSFGVAGFLLPGDKIDVLGTRMIDKGVMKSNVLMKNIKVLAVDLNKNPEKKDESVVVRALTLEMGLDDSLKLVKATQEGSVQVVLRDSVGVAERRSPPTTTADKGSDGTVRFINGVTQ